MECFDFLKDWNFLLFFKHSSNTISALLWFTVVMPPFMSVSLNKNLNETTYDIPTFELFAGHYGLDIFFHADEINPNVKLSRDIMIAMFENSP